MEAVSVDGRLTGMQGFREDREIAREDGLNTTNGASVVNLLLQALESNDQSLIDWCLERTRKEAIEGSVATLPSSRAHQLLHELSNRFLMFHQSASLILSWLTPLLHLHKATLPASALQDLVQKLKLRTEKFDRVAELKAKLEFVTTASLTTEPVRIVADRAVTYREEAEDEDME